VLRGEGEGGKRSLICSLCATEWDFSRLLCLNCGEETERKLPVYVAEEFPHVRVEACDTCRTYIKAVDLTRNGLAVPVVDELASVALNFWGGRARVCETATEFIGNVGGRCSEFHRGGNRRGPQPAQDAEEFVQHRGPLVLRLA
jgi:hypothetical protein